MTRRRWAAVVVALSLALPFLTGVAHAEEPPAPNLTSTTRDLGNGYGQTVWWDAEGNAYDLGLVFRLPAPKAVPGVPIPVVYGGGGDAAIEHGIALGLPRAWAYRVARCESGGDPGAYNRSSGASGLYQVIPSTWRATPQGRAGRSPFDGYANAEAAAWLYRNYGPSQWVCA
jgi:hypothetical protein